MTLKEKLAADFKDALKNKDQSAKNTINLVRAAIKQYEVDTRKELDDAGIMGILSKQVKMRKDALSDFEKAGRQDLVDAYNKEIEILKEYLPEEMSQEEIDKVVEETAKSMDITGGKENMGKLMGAVMQKVKGKADGNNVRKSVMKYLSK